MSKRFYREAGHVLYRRWVQQMANRAVVLLSGGVESLVVTALAHGEATKLYGLFVDYGQGPVEHERHAARQIARRYGVSLEEVKLEAPFLAGHPFLSETILLHGQEERTARAHIVPYRNGIFVSLAASLADTVGADKIWVGFDYRADNPGAAYDKSPAYALAQDAAIRAGLGRVGPTEVLNAPLQGNTKALTVTVGLQLGVNWHQSWSCYNALSHHCGLCGSCVQRREAFDKNGARHLDVDYCEEQYVMDQLTPLIPRVIGGGS